MSLRVRTTAAFAAAFQTLKKVRELVLHHDYLLNAPVPYDGVTYFCCRCNACGRVTPVIANPMPDQGGFSFVGSGSVNVACTHCGQFTKAVATAITSVRWAHALTMSQKRVDTLGQKHYAGVQFIKKKSSKHKAGSAVPTS